MRQLYHTTELIGIKDKNITLTKVFQHETHIEVQATLDYTPPKCCHCQGKQIKYNFQKPSKIPFIEIGGLPSLIRLKKRRFQCKDCHKVTVSETSLVQKNCQISELVKQKTAQLLLNREALTHIAEKLAISTSTVYRQLKQFQFKDDHSTLPEVLSVPVICTISDILCHPEIFGNSITLPSGFVSVTLYITTPTSFPKL